MSRPTASVFADIERVLENQLPFGGVNQSGTGRSELRSNRTFQSHVAMYR